ncbi:hypothetical protein BDR07DRAFT_1276259 [Suillus spraguei]|nr:hypothetical protein BDR07DRAFT_1276259 [Suillus spraguei]
MRLTTILGFLSAIIPFSFANTHGNHWGRRHQEIAVRARGDVDVQKRSFDNARFTFYDVGLGACGDYSAASDFIVALNVDQYGNGYPGPQCFLSITISYGGKTAQAVIMDECMGCPYGGLDFSRGLFDYFASESEGVIYGSWWYNSGSGASTTTTSTTWTPDPTSSTSTSTWTPDTPTYTPPLTPPPHPHSYSHSHSHSYSHSYSHSHSHSYSHSHSHPYSHPTSIPIFNSGSNITSSFPTTPSASPSPDNYSSSVGSGIAVPTGPAVAAPNSTDPQNLLVLNQALIDLGIMLVVENGN